MYKYRPILHWKRGERSALSQTAARSNVVPFIILGADRYVDRKATKKRAAVPRDTVFVETLDATWGNAPICLDASAVPVNSSGAHPLLDIVRASIPFGLQIIPATKLSAPSPYQSAAVLAHQMTGFGMALRVDLQEFSSASSWASTLPIPFGSIDLVLDLGSSVELTKQIGTYLDQAIVNLHAAASWRSVTIAGSSMPENFTGIAAGQFTIPRTEWVFWQRLHNLPLSYRLDYGDYATVPTIPPPEGIAWGFPINAKYTIDGHFLICRGVRTKGAHAVDMDQQLIGHAHDIVAYPQRNALPWCWANSKIDNISRGGERPAGLENWVTISVNRHLEWVRHSLP